MRYGIGGSSLGVGSGRPASTPDNPIIGDAGGGSLNSNGYVPATTAIRSGLGDVAQGRVSLIMLDTLVISLIAFYLWTRTVQKGG